MAKKKKGQRADGLIEVTHTMPDGCRRHSCWRNLRKTRMDA